MKNKIKSTIAAALFITTLSISGAVAQPGGGPPPSKEKKQEIEAMKVAFLTKKLSLTPEEAKVFWPVYNQYSDELDKLRDNHRKEMRDSREDIESMSDKEVEKLIDDQMAFRQSELDITKKYTLQFKKELPMKKVAALFHAEEDFKRELLHRLQQRSPRGEGLKDRHRE